MGNDELSNEELLELRDSLVSEYYGIQDEIERISGIFTVEQQTRYGTLLYNKDVVLGKILAIGSILNRRK